MILRLKKCFFFFFSCGKAFFRPRFFFFFAGVKGNDDFNYATNPPYVKVVQRVAFWVDRPVGPKLTVFV